jgi:hypothetical protein
MDNRNENRGRPPQELVLSEEGTEMLAACISHAREAVDLLGTCEADAWIKFKRVAGLLSTARREIGLVIEHEDGLGSALEDFNLFVENCVEFAKDTREVIETVYDAYLDFNAISKTDIEIGEALSRNKFTKMMLRIHGSKIRDDVKWVNGEVARCFIGLRFKEVKEAENDG